MTLKKFIQELKRQEKLFFLLFIILFILSLPFVLLNQRDQYKSYLFFTVAAKDTTSTEELKPGINSLYLISASDLFSETIVGWFKNPAFMDVIEQNSISPLPTLNVRKESKQNVMIFFTTNNQTLNNRILQSTITRLQESVNEYNKASGTQYTLTNVSSHTLTIPPNFMIDITIALLSSVLISLCVMLIRIRGISRP